MNLAREFDETEDIQELIREKEREKLPKIVVVKTNFENIKTISYVHNANGEIHESAIVNDKIHLLQGRTYYIPINTDINSDNYRIIKIPSDIADKIDVRYIKEKFACVVPLQHNTILRSGQRLCILSQ